MTQSYTVDAEEKYDEVKRLAESRILKES